MYSKIHFVRFCHDLDDCPTTQAQVPRVLQLVTNATPRVLTY